MTALYPSRSTAWYATVVFLLAQEHRPFQSISILAHLGGHKIYAGTCWVSSKETTWCLQPTRCPVLSSPCLTFPEIY